MKWFRLTILAVLAGQLAFNGSAADRDAVKGGAAVRGR